MKRLPYLVAIPLLSLGLTSCGSATTTNSVGAGGARTLVWDMELWGDNFTVLPGGHCTESDSRTNFENGAAISLVGPDDSEISSSTLSFGILRKSEVDPLSVTNFPNGNICYFAVTFQNVPVVSSYRVKTGDGQISVVSHDLAALKSSNWSTGEVIGGDFKQ